MDRKKPRVYYAHSMPTYGKDKEKKELIFLRKYFDVICPNNDIGTLRPFSRYLNLVRWADIVIISELEGYLTAGVFNEAKFAMENDIKVFLLHPSNNCYSLVGVESLSGGNSHLKDKKYGSVITKYDPEGSALLQGING